jgi:hypothetical protein
MHDTGLNGGYFLSLAIVSGQVYLLPPGIQHGQEAIGRFAFLGVLF